MQRQIDSSTHSGHHKTTNPAATDSSDDGCGPPHLRAACCPHAKQKKKREKQNTKRASTRPSKHKASLPNRPTSPPAASRRTFGHSSTHHPDRNSANHVIRDITSKRQKTSHGHVAVAVPCPVSHSKDLFSACGENFTLRDLTILYKGELGRPNICYDGNLRYWMKDNIVNYFFRSFQQATQHITRFAHFHSSRTLQQINYPTEVQISLGLDATMRTVEGNIKYNFLEVWKASQGFRKLGDTCYKSIHIIPTCDGTHWYLMSE